MRMNSYISSFISKVEQPLEMNYSKDERNYVSQAMQLTIAKRQTTYPTYFKKIHSLMMPT